MTDRIGKYELLDKLNKGGYGTCYKAKDDENKLYAIKKIEIENEEDKQSIINEINVLKEMKHKHSVEFIEYLVKDNYYYIVMELCDGDLNYFLKKNRSKLDMCYLIYLCIQKM